MKVIRAALGGVVLSTALLPTAVAAGTEGRVGGAAGDPRAAQSPADLQPTAAHREIARDMMRALVIGLENIAAESAGTSAPDLIPIRSFLNRLPAPARENLVKAARRFSAQGEQGLRTFYGPLYSPTPQARLRSLPAIVQSLQSRRNLILRPIRLPGAPENEPAASPSLAGAGDAVPFVQLDIPIASSDPGSGHPAPQKFSAPHENRLALTLQSIRVNSLNDDDTPDDEIYLGVWAVPGAPLLVRVPGNDYWRFTRGQTRTLDMGVKDFGSVKSGHSYAVFVSVFEYDEGTWGEIWSAFVQVAEFAVEEWLQAEVGTVAAEIVNYFLNDLWSWIAGWFENPDDFIDSAVLQYDFAREPKFWAPGPSGGAQVSQETIAIASGADANYRLTFRWTLRRVVIAR